MENIVDKIYRAYRSTKGQDQITVGRYVGYEIKIKTLSNGLFRLLEFQISNVKNGENNGKCSPLYKFYDNQLLNALKITVKNIDKGIVESEWERDRPFVKHLNSMQDEESIGK